MLTAAHCVSNVVDDDTVVPESLDNLDMYIGGLDFETPDQFYVRYPVAVILHPEYDPSTSYADAALLYFEEAITDIQPMPMYGGADEALFDSVGQGEGYSRSIPAKALGWGSTQEEDTDNNMPNQLQEV